MTRVNLDHYEYVTRTATHSNPVLAVRGAIPDWILHGQWGCPNFRYMRSIKKALRGCIIMHSLDALSTALSLLSHKCLVGEYLNVEFCPDHWRGGLKRHNPRASFRSSQPATTDTLQRTTQSFRASRRSMPQANRIVAATKNLQFILIFLSHRQNPKMHEHAFNRITIIYYV